jgi:hypothetical protein
MVTECRNNGVRINRPLHGNNSTETNATDGIVRGGIFYAVRELKVDELRASCEMVARM